MKKYFVFVFLILINLATVAQGSDWYKVKDVDAGYILKFPKKPKKEQQEIPTDKGMLQMDMYVYENSLGKNLMYYASHTQYPVKLFPDGIDRQREFEMLDASVKGAVNNSKGELISDEKIIFNGYNGRLIKIRIQGGYIIKMQEVLAGLNLYIIQTVYAESDDNNNDSKIFFDSFELINVKK